MKTNLNLTIISAVSINGIIGIDENIPWRIPEDFKHFRKTTMGGILIVGYNTYLTLPDVAFEGRIYFVLNGGVQFETNRKNVHQASDIKELFELLQIYRYYDVNDKIFVAGGASVYESLFEYCDEAIITLVEKIYPDGNKRFPLKKLINEFDLIDNLGWKLSSSGLEYKINYYKRKNDQTQTNKS